MNGNTGYRGMQAREGCVCCPERAVWTCAQCAAPFCARHASADELCRACTEASKPEHSWLEVMGVVGGLLLGAVALAVLAAEGGPKVLFFVLCGAIALSVTVPLAVAGVGLYVRKRSFTARRRPAQDQLTAPSAPRLEPPRR